VPWFGLFGKKNPVEKHAGRVADKRAQAPDRWDSIQALGAVIAAAKPKKRGEEPDPRARELAVQAVRALLLRFSFYVDPSITDQEEKEEAARLIIEAGDMAIEPVAAALRHSESLGWPLRLLEQLVPAERAVTELLALLETMDTEYERDPTRKIQVLQALEERRDPRIVPAVVRFLEDVSEPARFHAVNAIAAQADPAPARELATKQLAREDSVRIRAALLELFARQAWDVGPARATIDKRLPAGFVLDKTGVPKKTS
jgi:HEAT repeat protein